MNEQLANAVNALKEALKVHPVVTEYLEAQEAYLHDASLLEMMAEYNAQKMVYDTENEKEEKDETLIASVKERLDVIYKNIASSDTAHRLIEAEDAANELYNEIIRDLQSVVEHEHEHCSGDCSACGGCH